MPALSTMDRSIVLDRLVARIERNQCTGDGDFAEGLFPARRHSLFAPEGVRDDSIFPSVVTVFLLQESLGALSEAGGKAVDRMRRRVRHILRRYANNSELPIYNFWQNHPSERFLPNNRLLSRYRFFRLPEDIDTTAYVYLIDGSGPKEALKLRDIVSKYTGNGAVRNTLPPYRRLQAYSTWVGGSKMPMEFDICALANMMLLFGRNNLPPNVHDKETCRFIQQVIAHGHHVSHPFEVAPWYGDTSVILYHVVRAATSHPLLRGLEAKLRDELIRRASRESRPVHRVMLSTSRMRLGLDPLPDVVEGICGSVPTGVLASISQDASVGDSEASRFRFFIGSLLTPFENRLTRRLAAMPMFQLSYSCPALNKALLLEHTALTARS